jgi:hypothetical protein
VTVDIDGVVEAKIGGSSQSRREEIVRFGHQGGE